jgi:hypothetical protein
MPRSSDSWAALTTFSVSLWRTLSMQLEALKVPGSKLASEHHGGKAGRFWGHTMVVSEQEISFQPKKCKRCQEAIIFTEQEEPHCPVCGAIKGRRPQTEPRSRRPKQERIKRQQGYKRFRMYGQIQGQPPAEI